MAGARSLVPWACAAGILVAVGAFAIRCKGPPPGGSDGAPVPREETTVAATATAAESAAPVATPPVASAQATAEARPPASAAATSNAGVPARPATTASARAAETPSAAPTASVAAAPAETAKPIASPPVGDGAFRAWLTAPGKQKVGEPGHVNVVLTATGDYHCNEKYPYRFKLGAAPAGLSYPEPVVRNASIGAARSTMQVPFVASRAGDFPISGKFSFSVCTSSQCVVDSRDLAITVHVE